MFQTFYKSLYEPFLKDFNLSLILPLLLSFVMRMGCRKFEICRNDKVINCINRSSRHNWKQNSKLEDCSIIFNGCVTVKMSKIVTTIGWLIVKTLIVADSKKYFIFITLNFKNIFWSSNISSHFVWCEHSEHTPPCWLSCVLCLSWELNDRIINTPHAAHHHRAPSQIVFLSSLTFLPPVLSIPDDKAQSGYRAMKEPLTQWQRYR